jgi:hypothetical protein
MENLRNRIKRVIKFSRDKERKEELICSAIRNLRPMEFYYLHGYRTVEPFALGVVLTEKQDNLSLLCWQTSGFSDLNETVGWKLYRVSDMEDMAVQNEHFTGIRPGYDPENLEMAQVICCVPAIYAAEPPAPAPVIIPAPPIPEIKLYDTEEEPPPPPPPPRPPEPQFRPIVRVISHNQLMTRFRNAHPEPLPKLEGLIWEEPLAAPFPDPAPPEVSKTVTEAPEEEDEPQVRADKHISDYGMHTAD